MSMDFETVRFLRVLFALVLAGVDLRRRVAGVLAVTGLRRDVRGRRSGVEGTVRRHLGGGDFESTWRRTLHDGLLAMRDAWSWRPAVGSGRGEAPRPRGCPRSGSGSWEPTAGPRR